MRTKSLVSLAVAALALGSVGAQAAPVSVTGGGTAGASKSSGVTEVQYRRGGGGRFYRGGGRGWRGPGIGLGIGAGLLAGSIIASQAYRPRAGYYYDDEVYDGPYYAPEGYSGDPRRLCAENFRSFEWNTGLYTTYGGEKKLCPYLR